MVVNVNKKRKARYVIMNLKKKIAMAMAMAAVCSSIVVPTVANAGEIETRANGCIHDWRKTDKEPTTSTYTMHHGYSVGDDEYKDCLITVTTTTTTYRCGVCGEEKQETTTTQTHSACGL